MLLRLLIIALAALPSGALAAQSEDVLKACETILKERLKSPSSYQRVASDVTFTPDLSGDNAKYVLPNMDCDGKPAPYNAHRDCTGFPNAITADSGKWQASILFDADNAFGAAMRGTIVCDVRARSKDSPIQADQIEFTVTER